MDESETGCSWNSVSKVLTVFYKVNLNNRVWSVQEKEALVNLPHESKLRFWDCSTTEPKSSEGEYLEQMMYDDESNTIVQKGLIFIKW